MTVLIGGFKNAQKTKRKCWCIEDGTGNIVAVCIYKHEQNAQLTDNGEVIPGRILKLCTFKVHRKARGKKLGEQTFVYRIRLLCKKQVGLGISTYVRRGTKKRL